jgi:hypothetical protein
VATGKPDTEPTLAERWFEDQQQWQRTLMTYLDSMMRNDDFLVHLGNAMRGSLLAGKPYPTAENPGAAAEEAPSDDRLDRALFAINQLQGQLQDVVMTLEEIRGRLDGQPSAKRTARAAQPARSKGESKKVPPPKARKRRVRG